MEGEEQREIEKLVESLKPEDRELFRAMPESELIRLHSSYGMWLRNQFRQNNLPHLFKYCSTRALPETLSFDAIQRRPFARFGFTFDLIPREMVS